MWQTRDFENLILIHISLAASPAEHLFVLIGPVFFFFFLLSIVYASHLWKISRLRVSCLRPMGNCLMVFEGLVS